MTEYHRHHLESCVKGMEESCLEARRRLAENGNTLDVAEELLHIFAWGWANASTGLSTAIRSVQRDMDLAQAEPPEKQN